MFVGYRVGAACSAYPTVVGGPGVYRAYERGARCARTISRGSGDRWRHGRAVPGTIDPVTRAHPVLAGRPARAGRGGLRGGSDGVRAGSCPGRGRDRVCGRRTVEAATTLG